MAETVFDYSEDYLSAISESLAKLFDSLSESQKKFFEGGLENVVRQIVSGEYSLDFTSFTNFIMGLIGENMTALVVLPSTVLGANIAFSIVQNLGAEKVKHGVATAVNFACTTVIVVIVCSFVVNAWTACRSILGVVSMQVNLSLPIMLTIMTSIGAVNVASVYSPVLAIISVGLTDLIEFVILPMLMTSFAFGIIGNISDEVKLGKTSELFCSIVKWLFGTGFFLLSAFMALQGITATSLDGFSVRSAKFTVGKFVPIIGGYLSDSVGLIVSGGIMIKNAMGYVTLILLGITLLPIIVKVALLSLSLKFSAALIEPIGNKMICNILDSSSKVMSLTSAIMIGTLFLYFIFILIVIATGNAIL